MLNLLSHTIQTQPFQVSTSYSSQGMAQHRFNNKQMLEKSYV